jgi:hypothetical protein
VPEYWGLLLLLPVLARLGERLRSRGLARYSLGHCALFGLGMTLLLEQPQLGLATSLIAAALATALLAAPRGQERWTLSIGGVAVLAWS